MSVFQRGPQRSLPEPYSHVLQPMGEPAPQHPSLEESFIPTFQMVNKVRQDEQETKSKEQGQCFVLGKLGLRNYPKSWQILTTSETQGH